MRHQEKSMISYLKGTLLTHTEDGAMIVVAGVGYVVSGTWLKRETVNTEIELYCYHYLENQTIPRLLAIRSQEERDLVISLLDVSGVGPKMAGKILDALAPKELITAITSGDLVALSRVKGLGKKTAQKIILELGKTLVLDTPQSSPYSEALLSLGFTQNEISIALKNTNTDGMSESQALSALMRNVGKKHG
jgi:holliday junction DNA helicase RuvA